MDKGDRLGRYEILELIGRGGMGEVYRARDTRLNRVVAIKALRQQLSADQTARARFEREARAVAALSHPNIVAIYDVGDALDVSFVVTELLPGVTLERRLREGPLPIEKVREYALQVLRGLAAAHVKGILHRDLKPANVFVTSGDQIKILDFGLALMTGQAAQDSDTMADARTRQGELLGTPAYMAPEQMRQQHVDQRADIFAFGAVLYEMLSGKRAFDGPSTVDIVTAVLAAEPRPFESLPAVADDLAAVALRCLEKDPGRRFQAVDEIAGALTASSSIAPAADHRSVTTSRPRNSVAVLPFADLSPDQQLGYLCDGIAEEIIGGLARVPGLRVAARTSAFQFKGRSNDVRQIGLQLGVEAILEGSVRAAGTRLRVATQLVDVHGGFHLWSERFDGDTGDVFAVEDEIATAVVTALQGRLARAGDGGVLTRGTAAPEAHTLYLKGRHHWNKRTEESLRTAAAFFHAAIDRDPAYGQAYGALAELFITLGVYGAAPPRDVMPKARAAARQALTVSDAVPGPLATLATLAAVYDWDWAEAARLFGQATVDDAESPTTHHWHAMYCLLPQRRFPEAEQALTLALNLDPLSSIIGVSLGLAAYLARRYDEAERRLENTLALDRAFAMGHFFLGQVLTEQGRYGDAIKAFDRGLTLAGDSPEFTASRGYALARAGDLAAARGLLDDLAAAAARRYVSPVLPAHILVGLGEHDAALDALERAEHERAAALIWIGVRPLFDPLRQLPRFAELCTRIGLPQP